MTTNAAQSKTFLPLRTALGRLFDRLSSVDTERIRLDAACGRVLAEDVHADRPSPPVDVSAMDGIAVRAADLAALQETGLPIDGEAAIGEQVPELAPGHAMWIFTGGPVPRGADLVDQREWLIEAATTVRLRADVDPGKLRLGLHIRSAGENVRRGDAVASPGQIITPTMIAALASVGCTHLQVQRRVRVSMIVTGDELVEAACIPSTTGLRDSNGPSIVAMLDARPWIDVVHTQRIRDNFDAIVEAIAHAMECADCVLTTGGVSIGDHDHVPGAVATLGGETIFHRLAIKPGKPLFAAAIPGGRTVIGLPGNGVSALVTARRIALPALAKLAGVPVQAVEANARVTMCEPNARPIDLTHFRLVDRTAAATASFTQNKGSGDVFAAAKSDGFVEIPPGCSTSGPFDFYAWGGQ